MVKGIFVTGTGTDVGKTYVTALIVKKLADAGIHKDSRIWVQGFLELVDCTRNGGSEKDKRLKLSLTGWQTKPPRTAQRTARKQSPGAAQPPLPPVEVVDGDRERLPE